MSHFDLARKDCLGTARNTTSKVWYTVADGVLSDVYYPTVDNTNLETLQYVVTDGSTFTDLQARDMTYTVEAIQGTGGMACKVTASDKDGKYSDPDRVHHRPEPELGADARRLQARGEQPAAVRPVRPDGQRQRRRRCRQRRRRFGHRGRLHRPSHPRRIRSGDRDERDEPRLRAAGLRRARRAVHGGIERFAGSESDGLVQLDSTHALTPTFPDARDGNVVGTARVALDVDGETVLALGFGATQEEAVGAAEGSLHVDFDKTGEYKKAWKKYDDTLTRPRTEKLPGLSSAERKSIEDAYYLSANVIKASEDKTFPGAIVASLASPWGQAISAGDPANTYFGSYREVFARDLYEAWTGLLADGDLSTARDATLFLLERQQLPDGSIPRNSLVNGKTAPDLFGVQLDEVAFPLLMADQLGMTDATLYADHIRPGANFLQYRRRGIGHHRRQGISRAFPDHRLAGPRDPHAVARTGDAMGSAAKFYAINGPRFKNGLKKIG